MQRNTSRSLLYSVLKLFLYLSFVIGGAAGSAYLITSQLPRLVRAVFIQTDAIGVVGGVQTLNPLFVRRGTTEEAFSKILFRGLMTYDNSGMLVGDLAEKWEFRNDAKELEVTLREDIFWSDRVPITTNDVLFTYQLTQQEEYTGHARDFFKNVAIEAPSDKVLIFRLPGGYVPFLDTLTFPVMPLHAFGANDISRVTENTFLRNGPYSGIFSTVSAHVESFSNNGMVQIISLSGGSGKATCKFYQSPEALKMALKLGAVNRVVTMQQSVLEEFVDVSKLTTTSTSLIGQQYTLLINANTVDDADIRKAILLGIDSASITGGVLSGPYPKESPYWVENADIRAGFDEAAAREGIQDKIFSLVTIASLELSEVAQQVKTSLEAAGAVVTIQEVTKADFDATIAQERKFDLLLIPLELGRDPDQYSFWHSSQIPHPGLNVTGLKSRRVDKALEQGRVNVALESRKRVYAEFQQYLLEEYVTEFLGYPKIHVLSRQNRSILDTSYVWTYADFWRSLLENS